LYNCETQSQRKLLVPESAAVQWFAAASQNQTWVGQNGERLSSDSELCYNRRVISVVYLSNQSPSKLADGLIACGYHVWEALSVSEVLYLIEHETVHAVVVAPEVEDKELVSVQLRNVTIKLKEDAKLQDLIWELSNLFPTGSDAVQ
jgi:hypothetical protein